MAEAQKRGLEKEGGEGGKKKQKTKAEEEFIIIKECEACQKKVAWWQPDDACFCMFCGHKIIRRRVPIPKEGVGVKYCWVWGTN